MKYLLVIIIFSTSLNTFSQKKLIPVNQSILTGVTLPIGSTQDKRLLMESAAKSLLELESKKANVNIQSTEVFYLPSVANCGFNSDSLVNQLIALGWAITPIETDNKFVWLQKNNSLVITYLSMDKKNTNLYFGEATQVSNQNSQVNSNTNNQPQNIDNVQIQSTPNPPVKNNEVAINPQTNIPVQNTRVCFYYNQL